MEGWIEVPVFRQPKRLGPQQVAPREVSCTSFDDSSDLVWVGSTDGYVQSFNYVEDANSPHGKSLAPYTSFRCFEDAPILEILPHSAGILALSKDGVKFCSRTGITKATFTRRDDPRLQNLQSMTFFSSSHNEIVVGSSTSNELIKLDLSKKKKVVQSFTFEGSGVNKLTTNNRHIIIGKNGGQTIDLMSPTDGEIMKQFPQTTQAFSDFYCKEQTLISCGYSKRGNAYINDRFVNVIDMRLMKALPPVAFPAGAAYARLHPKLPTIAIIASASGLIHFVDIFNPTNVYLYQANVGSYMTSMSVSPSGDYFVFGDSFQNLHLWSHNATSSFTMYTTPLEYAVPFYRPPGAPSVSVDDADVPLSFVGMPYYKETLLSAWPYDSRWKVRSNPAKIDPEILSNAKIIDNTSIGFSIYDADKYGHRNIYVDDSVQTLAEKLEIPKFISEKEPDEQAIATAMFDFKPKSSNVIPPCYNRLEILYSKFGVDDFDFDYFNQTRYAGLETHVSNSYCNPLLQLYRFTPAIFNLAMDDIAEEHLEGSSLTTELGYLFDMLVKANGRHCNASNFQKVFNTLAEAHQAGLVHDTSDVFAHDEQAQRRLIQAFNRFLMDRLALEESARVPAEAPIADRRMGRAACVAVAEEVVGLNYQMQAQRMRISHTLDIVAPVQARASHRRINLTILNYIEESVNSEVQKSMGQQVMKHSLSLKSLPDVFSLNLSLSSGELAELKAYRRWLLPEFYASENHSGTISFNTVTTSFSSNVKRYELLGYVAEITAKDGRSHLVSFVKIPEVADGRSVENWYLFNDFLVVKVSEQEAFNFQYWWKKPVILLYNNVSAETRFDGAAWRSRLDDGILYRDHFSNAIRENIRIEYELLARSEAPKPGTLVAIDAEFVNLTKEQVEIKSDGSRSLVRPSKQALARVSVLRGEGPKESVPFIDDYIATTDRIEDYLTSFSGIEDGDLDPATSDKPLVSLNVAYRKLWLLLNLGCVFIGHGLSNDFRAINIQVPPEQVRDTAIYFYLKQYKRKLSLKFLTYILLDEKVQTGNHDSIEDARSALKLYKKYLELESAGEMAATLSWVYSEGRNLRFKAPS